MQYKLNFKEVYLGIFYAFSMKGANIKNRKGKIIDRAEAEKKINDYAEKCEKNQAAVKRKSNCPFVKGSAAKDEKRYSAVEWNADAHYEKGFEYAQQFFIDKLPKNLIRFRLVLPCSMDIKPDELNIDIKESFWKRTDSVSVYLRELLPEDAWNNSSELSKVLNNLIKGPLLIGDAGFNQIGHKTTEVKRILESQSYIEKSAINLRFLEEAIPGLINKQSTYLNNHSSNIVNLPALSIANPHDPRLSIPIDVYLSIFPDNDMGLLFFNLKLGMENRLIAHCIGKKDLSTDDLIFIIHSLFEDRFEVNIHIPGYLKELGINDGNHKMCDVAGKFIEFVLKSFGNRDNQLQEYRQPIKKRILEIRDSGDGLNLENPEHVFNRYPEQIYGLMVGDEGWRFVPKEFSEARIRETWGSRDFVSVLASSNGILLLNFRNTDHYDNYVKWQRELREIYQKKVENYFNFNYDVSGLEHGAFLCLERAMLTKLSLNLQTNILYENIKSSKDKKKSPKRLQEMSKNINNFHIDLSNISAENKAWEVDNLYNNLSKSMELNKDLNDIKKMQEAYFNQCYSIENNQFTTSFNKWGKWLAVMGIILTILGLYLSGAQIYLGEPGHHMAENLDHFFRDWLDTWIDPVFSSEPILSQITRLCASLNPFSRI